MTANSNDRPEATLPVGWIWATIGEIACAVNSGFPSGKHNTQGKGVPHLRPMNISPSGEIDMSLVKYVESSGHDNLREGDVVFNNTNSPKWLGKSTHIKYDTNWAYSNHMTRIRLLNGIESGWVAYSLHFLFLTGFFQLNCRHHVNQASINATFLSENTRIPLPPLPEQHRIVETIETQFTRLDAAVAALERVKANLARYKVSVLAAACEGRLVPTEAELARAEDRDYESAGVLLQRILLERRKKWEADQWKKELARARKKVAQAKRKAAGQPSTLRAIPAEEWEAVAEEDYARYLPKNDTWKQKYKEPAAPDTESLAELPEGWVWARSEQISDFITKGTTPKGPKLHRVQSASAEVPFIKVYNLTFSGSLGFGVKPTFVSADTHRGELSRSIVHPGDVLMNIVGPPLGKVSIVPDTYPEWNINQAIARYRPLQGVTPIYLSYLLRAEHILNWAAGRAKATAGQLNLTLEICRDLPIPLAPHIEQHRIVAEVERRLSVIADIERTIDAGLIRAAHLRQSILKRAFEGKLVPQDPNDEPASVLLERIRQEAQ